MEPAADSASETARRRVEKEKSGAHEEFMPRPAAGLHAEAGGKLSGTGKAGRKGATGAELPQKENDKVYRPGSREARGSPGWDSAEVMKGEGKAALTALHGLLPAAALLERAKSGVCANVVRKLTELCVGNAPSRVCARAGENAGTATDKTATAKNRKRPLTRSMFLSRSINEIPQAASGQLRRVKFK